MSSSTTSSSSAISWGSAMDASRWLWNSVRPDAWVLVDYPDPGRSSRHRLLDHRTRVPLAEGRCRRSAALEGTMELSDAIDFARTTTRSVVVTLKSDGRPQLSNVLHVVGDDGVIRISITESRAKAKNLRRDPRVSLHVTSDDFWRYAVIEA